MPGLLDHCFAASGVAIERSKTAFVRLNLLTLATTGKEGIGNGGK